MQDWLFRSPVLCPVYKDIGLSWPRCWGHGLMTNDSAFVARPPASRADSLVLTRMGSGLSGLVGLWH